MKEKQLLRNEIIELLKSMDNKGEIEQQLRTNLMKFEKWINAKSVGLTLSRKLEWDTSRIIKASWGMEKIVALPKCYPQSAEMSFYQCTAFAQLENAYLDLLEPNPRLCRKIDKYNIDLIIVPGLVFDQYGNRIGYGGGYYDRYLSDYNGTKIALAANFQLVDKIHKEPHDIRVDYIVTESTIIDCSVHKNN
ncbi:5-formyltetrahydrofolate cyclo-ligase [Gracilibacillus xinjiangensis]|uniref:5-formyltetrahydrofolate cyclo-ligase n=1 Tax=Gracilibacillus xinjiangensis TaxID=1193282 RepID=A0ABV8WWH6_9BACI